MWSNGIQALYRSSTSPEFDNLPPIFEIVGPILKASPAALQFDMQELLTALYKASSRRNHLLHSTDLEEAQKADLPAVALRRMSPDLPQDFQANLREIILREILPLIHRQERRNS